MQQYRLRNAPFDIVGTRYTDYQSVVTSAFSEDGLHEPALSPRVHSQYRRAGVFLADKRYLEACYFRCRPA